VVSGKGVADEQRGKSSGSASKRRCRVSERTTRGDVFSRRRKLCHLDGVRVLSVDADLARVREVADDHVRAIHVEEEAAVGRRRRDDGDTALGRRQRDEQARARTVLVAARGGGSARS
jgi:hypothetical protein